MPPKYPLQDLTNASLLATQQGKHDEAYNLISVAMQDPKAGSLQRTIYTMALNRVDTIILDTLLKNNLMAAMGHNDVDGKRLFPKWRHYFNNANEYEALREGQRNGAFDWDRIQPIFTDEYVLKGLSNLLFADWRVEEVFTALRRALLLDFYPKGILKTRQLPLLCALAEHCFLNEFVFSESAAETTAIEGLPLNDPISVALLGCYRRLSDYEFDVKLSAVSAFRKMIVVQVLDLETETAIKNDIVSLVPITDTVSQNVQSMYEDNPYPRWTGILFSSPKKTGVYGEILIAGCGTGRSSISAADYLPDCHFTAIDLSKSSMAYAARMADVYNCPNISFAHLDIMDVSKLDKKFDAIQCTGVLHHMADPVAGWKALTGCLQDGGLMLIGLYSMAARVSVEAVRNYITSKKYQPTLEDIRKVRQEIAALPSGDPLHYVSKLHDFYSVSNVRDFVFHVQEKTYDLNEIGAILDELGLEIHHFALDTHPILAKYRERFPDDAAMVNLSNWHALEQDHPETFIGMYNFACGRKGEAVSAKARAISDIFR